MICKSQHGMVGNGLKLMNYGALVFTSPAILTQSVDLFIQQLIRIP